MNGKRAITYMTVGLIMVLVLAIVLLSTVDLWASVLTGGVNVEACRRSIATSTAAKEYTAGFIHPGYDCPVKPDGLDEKDSAKILHKIAREHLKSCWYKTGGRDSQIGIKRIGEGSWGFDENTCFVCSEFTVNQEIDTQYLANYLKNNMPGTDVPYIDYLSTDWHSEDNSHYFVHAPSIGALEKLETLKAFSEQSQVLDNEYFVVYAFTVKEPKYEVPKGWTFTPSPGTSDQYRHLFILPKEDWSNLKCKKIYHPMA